MPCRIEQTDEATQLFIDGELQFDSRDEAVYHECLALPAVALAQQRFGDGLSILICGGGDGLLLREVLKFNSVAKVGLVDIDSEVVDFASSQLRELNQSSFQDGRVSVHIADAWQYVEQNGEKHHVILSDLTVPQVLSATRMHSRQWYGALSKILYQGGVIAANTVSPSQSPEAYWSVLNSMRAANLFVRPYRIAMPSFRSCGYGPDWGFAIGSNRTIEKSALLSIDLPASRQALPNASVLERLFLLPAKCAEHRHTSYPIEASEGQQFLESLRSNRHIVDYSQVDWDSLSESLDFEVFPERQNDSKPITPYAIENLIESRWELSFRCNYCNHFNRYNRSTHCNHCATWYTQPANSCKLSIYNR